jgi:integrase/recombinase XerD
MDSRGNAALMQEYIAFLRVEKGLRPLTCAAYQGDLLQFAEFVEPENTSLAHATRAHIAGFLGHLGKHGVDSRSSARKLSCLRGFYRWLLLDERIDRDPTVNFDTPAMWKVLPKSLAETEVNEMLARAGTAADHPQADAIALRDCAILELLYAGGLRVSELTGLRVADLSLDARRALVRGKGDKERIVPLGRAAIEASKKYLAQGRPGLQKHGRDSGCVFLSTRGTALTRQWIWRLVKSSGRSSGSHASPHMLRHSCATHMVEHGADLRTVQTLLGHADITTTQIYTHLALGRLKAVHREHHPRARRPEAE